MDFGVILAHSAPSIIIDNQRKVGQGQLCQNRLEFNKAVYTSRSDDKVLPKHLGRSSNAKTARNAEKANADGPTDEPTDRHSGL